MNFHLRNVWVLALLLLFSLSVQAKQANLQGQMFELTIHGLGSNIDERPIKLRVMEGAVSTITTHSPAQVHSQYSIRAYRPSPTSLHPATSNIPSPLVISIRIDTSDDGKTWLLKNHLNLTAAMGATVAAEFSDAEKSTHLIVSSRLVSEAEHQMSKK